MIKEHSFHIPVMGMGFTIDAPLRVSQYGIDSVISIGDDGLLEKFRQFYCEKFEIPYMEISEKINDFRAERITSYLNLVNKIAKKKFEELKSSANEKSNEIKKYINLLPDTSTIKEKFKSLTADFDFTEISNRIKNSLTAGSIDVNIMTKVDKDNYKNGEKLPVEFNDAHAALRGYANSDLNSSIVLSAGMNPRLYSYFENFNDFFPNEKGEIKKKVILKVSDFRSALIQGKFLAKKGIWVSEYRIESGLNCGGHAFATTGFLLGTILDDFKERREELTQSVYELLEKALTDKNKIIPQKQLSVKITAQGGVGTAEEHKFLMDFYNVDSVGWGSPFLLVPEAVSIDEETINKLIAAKEDDLYLSNISPLGVLFNNLRGNTKDAEKQKLVEAGKAGSVCKKRFLSFNSEFTEKPICTASRTYQQFKIKELEKENLSEDEYKKHLKNITDKTCICVGLNTSALLAHNIKIEAEGVSVCPGPNLAYFSKKMTLQNMVDHIYGRDVFVDENRPNMFIKELNIYIDYLKNKLEEAPADINNKEKKFFRNFEKNLNAGIDYYHNLFTNSDKFFKDIKTTILKDLEICKNRIENLALSAI